MSPQFLHIGGKKFTLEYLGAEGDNGGSSPWTFASKTFGDADADRWVVAAVFAPSTSTVNYDIVDYVLIGGKRAIRLAHGYPSTYFHGAYYYAARIPAGTSGDIVVHTHGGRASMSIAWYRAICRGLPHVLDIKQDNTPSATSGTPLSITLNASTSGAVLALGLRQNAGGGNTWTTTGITVGQNSPFPVDPANGASMFAASDFPAGSSSVGITAYPSQTNATNLLFGISLEQSRVPWAELVGHLVSTTTGIVHTLNGVPVGDNFAGRKVVLFVAGEGSAASMTITVDGVSASAAVIMNSSAAGSIAAYVIEPTGTSVDVVVTFAGSQSDCGVWAFAVHGTTAIDATVTQTANTNPLALNYTAANDSVWLAFSKHNSGNTQVLVTGDGVSQYSGDWYRYATITTKSIVTGGSKTVNFAMPSGAVRDTIAIGLKK